MAHWSDLKEKAGSLWQMRLVFFLYKITGLTRLRFFLHPIVCFFFIFYPSVRKTSLSFLRRVYRLNQETRIPGKRDVYRNIYNFAYSLIEKMAAWSGDVDFQRLVPKTPDVELLKAQLREGQGAVVLCSHLGNIEMLRAISSSKSGKILPSLRINAIVDFIGTSKYNGILKEVNPESGANLITASSLDASAIIHLHDKIGEGEIVVIAGDRTAARNRERTTAVHFLGELANFPQGSFILAKLLEAPVYFMFAVREKDTDLDSPYAFYLYKAKYDFSSSRDDKLTQIKAMTEEYAGHLEALCLKHPLQWFNFYDFWEKPNKSKG